MPGALPVPCDASAGAGVARCNSPASATLSSQPLAARLQTVADLLRAEGFPVSAGVVDEALITIKRRPRDARDVTQ